MGGSWDVAVFHGNDEHADIVRVHVFRRDGSDMHVQEIRDGIVAGLFAEIEVVRAASAGDMDGAFT